ncbi:MAG TPA: symmetrical bis(5'-nucleosyl)-tetraphosphatase [Thermoanaerobaculia bacterium]|nr:symmetrical bis(5'-nucleosyl)-tetraphosphatase [Thermoanaerobaculia bacterium]
MATHLIGDVHGCIGTLGALLERCEIDLERDRLVLVGDLVGRGPRSLDVLRWAASTAAAMGERFEVVLGNHDLQLLARARGVAERRPSDRLDAVLEAPDRDRLLDWLGARPLALQVGAALVVHAGLDPAWSVAETLQRAARLRAALAGPPATELLRRDGLGEPATDDPALAELRRDLAILTRLRMLDAEGRPAAYTGPPEDAPAGLVPWFRVPGRRAADTTVVFGHWAALGLLVEPRLIGLDSGCAWGRQLTALRLDNRRIVQQDVVPAERPGG